MNERYATVKGWGCLLAIILANLIAWTYIIRFATWIWRTL